MEGNNKTGSNLDTASLMSFTGSAAAHSGSNLDTQSAQIEFTGGEPSSSSASSKIMENYLILDRLNKKQQRKQQQLKLKQLQAQQQLNELRQRQLELELAAQLAQQQLYDAAHAESELVNSKHTAHYAIPMSPSSTSSSSPANAGWIKPPGVGPPLTATTMTNPPLVMSNTSTNPNVNPALNHNNSNSMPPSSGVTNLRLVLQQQQLQHQPQSSLRYSQEPQQQPAVDLQQLAAIAAASHQSEPYQFVQVGGF